MNPILRQKINRLPEKPGVYLYKDKSGRIIYVGKAVSLRDRVRSYFNSSHDEAPRTRMLVDNIRDLDFILTRNEIEALMLENTLIKKHAPYFNVQLKDDKTYPFLKITNEKYPRLMFTRRYVVDGSRYFGPYSSAAGVRDTLRFLNRVFPLRLCEDMKKKPCMYSQIGQCLGPCGDDVDEEEYQRNVRAVTRFLEGRDTGMIEQLKSDMAESSANMQFERAAVLRDRVAALEEIAGSRQHVVGMKKNDADIIGVAPGEEISVVEILHLREGAVAGHDAFVLRTAGGNPVPDILGSFLNLHYGQAAQVPGEILLEAKPADEKLIAEFLATRRGAPVKIAVPSRGAKKILVDMARNNAAQRLDDEVAADTMNKKKNDEMTRALAKRLGMRALPRVIIGMDISTIQGAETVGSIVSFRDGAPQKKGYRKFIIRDVSHDDFGALTEMTRRFFTRVRGGREEKPDLVIVDGGRGQVGAVERGLAAAEFTDPQLVIGIAKEKRVSHILGQETPIIFQPDEPAYKLVMRVDNEAHRFAITFHRKKRSEAMFQ